MIASAVDQRGVFVRAEIGANHGGSVENCEKLIRIAARCGVDAIKMQKRDNDTMFTKAALAQPYNNEYSYGKTYGEHRRHLDWFGKKEFTYFKEICDELDVIFFATAFDIPSVDFLQELDVPCIKVASCDLNNLPLLSYIADTGKPMIISTGGAYHEEIVATHDYISSITDNFALLHCVSTYPTRDYELSLGYIGVMMKRFPCVIGFSSHHPGLLPHYIAYTQGARIFEVHVTSNRALPGTDHSFSLEAKGLETLCEDIRRIPTMLGSGRKEVSLVERDGFIRKMGKSVRVAHHIPEGKTIETDDLVLKAPAEGISPYCLDQVIGKIAIHDLSTAEPLTWEGLR